ncbi:MAG: carbohydrate-binding domain-containing protein, partial [Clostridia bacterium]|nr:carbohydrate-binding domain-containing protein [Clostridia bacterium]
MLKKEVFNRISTMVLCFLLIFLYGCSETAKEKDTAATDDKEGSQTINSMEIKDAADFFINTEPVSWTDTGDIHDIILSDSGSIVDTEYITVEGAVITIHRGGKYRITGALSNGSICINCGKTEQVSLLLDAVSLASQD